MSINFNDALGIHTEALKLRADRTKVLAANIANENTPGFQARDIDFRTALGQASAEDPHGLLLDSWSESEDPMYRVPFHSSRDGNTVEIGVEQAAFSQNASDFQISLTFLNMKLKGLAKAIAGQ